MNRRDLLASASTLRPRPVMPQDFADPFWRGIMFGWDDAKPRPFAGLKPRIQWKTGLRAGLPPFADHLR